MRFEYPEFVSNIQGILRWFDGCMRESSGNKIPPSKFSYLGSRIKNFIKKENLTINEFKTLLWGVLNEKPKVYSPVYSFYFLDNLPQYKEALKKVKKREEEKNKEVEFNKEALIDEEENNEIGDDFFEDL